MSYDLLVFDPGVAPVHDRLAFMAWFKQVVRLREGHMLSNPEETSPALRAWHRDMSRRFPQAEFGVPNSRGQIEFNADYRFAPHAVFARFEWTSSRKAQQLALKLARQHSVGFFDPSGEVSAAYTVVDGKFVLAHAGERASA